MSSAEVFNEFESSPRGAAVLLAAGVLVLHTALQWFAWARDRGRPGGRRPPRPAGRRVSAKPLSLPPLLPRGRGHGDARELAPDHAHLQGERRVPAVGPPALGGSGRPDLQLAHGLRAD